MWAYVITASFPSLGDKKFVMLIHHPGSKRDVEMHAMQDGWEVKRVRQATLADFQDVTKYEDVLSFVKAEVRRMRDIEAENRRRAEIDRQLRGEKERREREQREKASVEARDLAISKAAGDLLSVNLEATLKGNRKIAAICAKVSLFFDQASLNKKDLYTAISVDFADFQSEFDCPRTNKMLGMLMKDLNEFLQIDAGIIDLKSQLAADRVSVENKVNSIGSRSHIFGGSGEWLLLSFLVANSAAKQDGRAIDSLQMGHAHRVQQVQRAVERAGNQQQLLEYRAKTAVSQLLVACGKSDTIEINRER